MRGKWILFGGIAVLVAIAAGALAWRQNHQAPAPPPVVQQAPPPSDEFTGNELSLSGKVQASKVLNVGAPVDGILEVIAVEAGQDVVAGQLLARIKNVRLETALEGATEELEQSQTRVRNLEASIIAARLEVSRSQADASRTHSELDRAEKTYQRQKMLFADGATPRLTYEKAQTDYNTLRDEDESKQAVARQTADRIEALNRDLDNYKRIVAQRADLLEQAKTEAGSSDVHAPVDGYVVARNRSQGETVTRDVEDLFQIATALSAMEVVVNPTVPQLKRLKTGQTVAIHVAEVPNEVIAGTVRDVNGAQVIIEFISPTPLIKPGVSAQVTIKLT